jgi:hypothetical protein
MTTGLTRSSPATAEVLLRPVLHCRAFKLRQILLSLRMEWWYLRAPNVSSTPINPSDFLRAH